MTKPLSEVQAAVDAMLSKQSQEDIDRAAAWALTNGLCLTRLVDGLPNTQHIPFMLAPTPFPEHLFDSAVELSPLFNSLVDSIARNADFLQRVLKATAEADPFTGRLLDIHRRVYCSNDSHPQDLMLGLLRSDYMINALGDNSLADAKGWNLQQVEINTIASAFGGLAGKCNALHRYFLQRQAGISKEDAAVMVRDNTPVKGMAAGLAMAFKAHPLHADENAVVLYIVQPKEANTADQRVLEQEIFESSGIRCVRRSLQDVHDRGTVREDGALVIDGYCCVVVYYRAGYTPDDYPTEGCWEARERIERSSAVKCPSIPYHLTGTKKVQQVIADGPTLREFIDDTAACKLEQVFARMSSLHDNATVQEAIEDPAAWVLKPQREGGGSLLYGDKMVQLLRNLKPSQRDEYILMHKILPPALRNTLISRGRAVDTLCLAEIGTFGVVLGDGKQLLENSCAGYVLRSKPSDQADGGVAAGVAALDSVALFST